MLGELKQVIKTDLVKKYFEQLPFKFIDDWHKNLPANLPTPANVAASVVAAAAGAVAAVANNTSHSNLSPNINISNSQVNMLFVS